MNAQNDDRGLVARRLEAYAAGRGAEVYREQAYAKRAKVGDEVIVGMPAGEAAGVIDEIAGRRALVRWQGGPWADWVPLNKLREAGV